MSTISITRKHSLPVDRVKTVAEQVYKDFGTKDISYKWNGNVLNCVASAGVAKGSKAKMTVTESSLQIDVDLPGLLSMFKGTVEKKLNEELDKLLKKG